MLSLLWCSYTYSFKYLVFHADRKQYSWYSKLEVIAFPALFLLETKICKRLTDAFLYPVKVSLKLSSESKQKLASQSPQPKWVILSDKCTLWFSGHLRLGSIASPWQRLIPLPVSEPLLCCSSWHTQASWTDTFSHPFGTGGQEKCALQKHHFFQKSHKRHQQWYLTQNKMDLNMCDYHFLSYSLS